MTCDLRGGERNIPTCGIQEGVDPATQTPVCMPPAPSFQLALATCDHLNGAAPKSLFGPATSTECAEPGGAQGVLRTGRKGCSDATAQLAWHNGRANCWQVASCHYSRPGLLLMTGLLTISSGGIIYLEIITLNFFSQNYLLPTFN